MRGHAAACAHPGHVISSDTRSATLKQLTDLSKEQVEKEKLKEKKRQEWPVARKVLLKVITNHYFELTCGVIILFNMLLVVVETDASVDSDEDAPGWLAVAGTMLLIIYTMELTAKLYVYRCDFFREMWNLIDFVIVSVDLVFAFCKLIGVKMPSVSILRVFRLVRLARAFKAAKSLKELNSLLRACACAMRAIFWGMVLMFLTLTVWGILAVQLIHPVNMRIAEKSPSPYDGCDRCARSYSTVFHSMLTFWKQLVAGDSWGQLCEPIVEEAPWAALFFAMVLVTVNLTMLNCILAVVVEAGAAAAAQDEHEKAMIREKEVAQAEGKLIQLCHGLDMDSSGSLTIKEFLDGFHTNKEFKQCLELMSVTETDMEMIFNICDEDDSGEVSYMEFIDQFRRIKHSGEQMLLHYVTDIRHLVNRMEKITKAIHSFTAEPQMKQLDDLGAAASNVEDGPSALSDVENKDTKPLQGGDSEKFNPEKLRAAVSDVLNKEKVERIWQINEDLSSIMKELAGESKVQTTLLNTLVQTTIDKNSQDTEVLANRTPSRDVADPDRVQLRNPAAGAISPKTPAAGSACCGGGVRVV